MKSILDPTFRYRASFDTDLRRTFARVRRTMPAAYGEQAAQRGATVTSIAGPRRPVESVGHLSLATPPPSALAPDGSPAKPSGSRRESDR